MFWVLCSDAPWRDLPERYGPWKTVYNRFNWWQKSGFINLIFNRLLLPLDADALVDWSAMVLNGSNIKTLQVRHWRAIKQPDTTGDNDLDRSRSGLGTKIHLATDGIGLQLNIVLSPGQAHESQFALRLLDGIGVQRQNGSMKRRGYAVLADKAYSVYALRNKLKK